MALTHKQYLVIRDIQAFFNYERKFDSIDSPSSVYDRKSAAWRFDTIQNILRSFSLAESLLKGRTVLIRRSRNQGVKIIYCWAQTVDIIVEVILGLFKQAILWRFLTIFNKKVYELSQVYDNIWFKFYRYFDLSFTVILT